jgi:hypothetical protein
MIPPVCVAIKTIPYQNPPYILRDWGIPPSIRCCEPKIHPHSAFALYKNSVHLGALTELQDK